MYRLVIIVLCVAIALGQEWEKPSFCNTNDCPRFAVLEEGNGYELRRYEKAMWVSTVVYATDTEEAGNQLNTAFNKLFNYIDGQNENSETIAMTAPVSTKAEPAKGPNGETKLTMSFYVPYSKQDDAPQPSNQDVFLESFPEMDIYTSYFSGFASVQDYIDDIQVLAEAIGDSSKYEQEYFYTAGYDSPFKWWDRRNEGWLVAKNQK